MDDLNLRLELETVKVRLAAAEEELSFQRASRIGPRLRRATKGPKLRVVLMCASAMIPAAAYAAVIGVPNTFTNGTIADANDVNANFSALVNESNAQDARLTALEEITTSHTDGISANFSSITTNSSNIASNTAELASDATLITNNFNNIALNSTGISTVTSTASANTSATMSNSSAISTNGAGIASNLGFINSHSGSITANVAGIGSNTSLIGVNTSGLGALQSTFASASLNGSTLTFSGVNVAIVNGTGTTDGALNGLGNLVVGYGENGLAATRSGSHNLVVGMHHEYTSFAGLIAGYANKVTGTHSSVSAGNFNTASGSASSVSAGYLNTASAANSSVSGGESNEATAQGASVSGGWHSTASGWMANISGG
jgi:hypothetical protein